MAQSVLIVEDEPNIVLSLEFLVKQAGYDVRVAHDGEAALRVVEESSPALILLDIMIPKRNGYDVCQCIRANPSWNDIRILMLTARGRDVEREKGMALGADDYINKPWEPSELKARLHAGLRVLELQNELMMFSGRKATSSFISSITLMIWISTTSLILISKTHLLKKK